MSKRRQASEGLGKNNEEVSQPVASGKVLTGSFESHVSASGKSAPARKRDSRGARLPTSSDSKEGGYSLRSCARLSGRVLLKATVWILVLFCIVFPILVKLFPSLPKEIVYLNAVKIPWHVSLADPQTAGIDGTLNFRLITEMDIVVGVWHVLPTELLADGRPPESSSYEALLASGHPVILYCHGNTGTRASYHRVELYKVLAAEGYHVVTFDYRGFGDSTGSPTSESGVVHDAKFMYRWVKQRSGSSPVYVWGHSLGTGIATKAVKELLAEGAQPHALVLESPFNSIADAALHHPFALPFRMLWWFDDVFIAGIHASGIYLQSDENILSVSIPILIMHAEDDYVVPYSLGVKLYEASKRRPSHFSPVTFKSFEASRHFEHKWICHAAELPSLLRSFFGSSN